MAGVLLGRLEREVQVEVAGGTLHVHWNQATNHVTLTGPADPVYRGVLSRSALSPLDSVLWNQ